MKKIIFFTCLIISSFTYAQIKIGERPGSINEHSVLELESEDKVLVITKMSNFIMNSIQPLPGALVYNTDQNCVFTYTGTNWLSLCDAGSTNTSIQVTTNSVAPTTNNMGDFWINDATTNKVVSIWDGNSWVPINNNPRKGSGVPTTITASNPVSGQIYVDETTGAIYAYDGTTWVDSNTSLSANNGVTITTNNEIQLGGVLTMPTIIATDATNTLAITGLQDGDITADDVVVVDRATGVLKKTTISGLFNEEVIELEATVDSQVDFTFPLKTTTQKVNVYRNGVRVDFTLNESTNTVTIEPEASCYTGDEIRIVQFY